MLLPLLLSCVAHAQSDTPDLARPGHSRLRSVDVFSPKVGQRQPLAGRASQLAVPLEDTFTLHSNPDATKIIYLDFDGHVVVWGDREFGYVPWNREGTSDTFSDEERTIIQLAWRSIAEDFLPFDVDVTTEEPPLEDLINTGGTDDRWGIRAVINHRTYTYSWAYVDSFADAEDTELYAWTGNFKSIDETWVWLADSVSHEAGHALGLSHDGTRSGVEYYPGHGEGIHDWSPIMGWTGYGLSQWSIGEYTDANNQQDDLAIITADNGFGYRSDDHGSTPEDATVLDLTSDVLSEGIIETSDDLDVFVFTVERPGQVMITVHPDSLAPNLDVAATLHDADGAVLVHAEPAESLSATIDTALNAGRYTITVDGVGYDDPKSDGYSDYASIGYFSLAASFDASEDTGNLPEDTGSLPEDTGNLPEDTGDLPVHDSGDTEETAGEERVEESPKGGCSHVVYRGVPVAVLMLLPLLVIRRQAGMS